VDWRMYGRSDRYYVKQFEEETNLRAYLLVDASASMDWTSRPGVLPPKLWYARQLAASLALLLLRQGDAVGLIAFDEGIRARYEPRARPSQWGTLLAALQQLDAGRGTDASLALRDVAARLRRRGLVVLLSDLLVDPEPTRTALRFLRHRGHEVLVFHVMDPGERELPSVREARFMDPETGDELTISVADLRAEYRTAVAEAVDEWRTTLAPEGMDYAVVETDRPMVHALRRYLRKRERLG
jgi:uncharacterized protein (DUF58 family)